MTLTCCPLAVSAAALMNRMFVVFVPEILLMTLSTQNRFVFLLKQLFYLKIFPTHLLEIHYLYIYYSCMVGPSKSCGSQKKEQDKALPPGQTF